MAIYILTHRPIKNWDTRFYTPIHMSTLENPDVKIQIKDIYPKLAEMNLLYNEHSASYYIWKKDKGPIKGMVQYRMLPKLTESEIKDILKEKDFILHTDYVQNLAWQFKRCHDPESRIWDVVYDEVKKTGLDDLTIQRWCNSAIVFSRNTIIAKKKDFDDYISWMTPILEKIRERLGFESMKDVEEFVKQYPTIGSVNYRCRILGFISERLETLYMVKRYGSIEEAIKHIVVPEYEMTMEQIPLL